MKYPAVLNTRNKNPKMWHNSVPFESEDQFYKFIGQITDDLKMYLPFISPHGYSYGGMSWHTFTNTYNPKSKSGVTTTSGYDYCGSVSWHVVLYMLKLAGADISKYCLEIYEEQSDTTDWIRK